MSPEECGRRFCKQTRSVRPPLGLSPLCIYIYIDAYIYIYIHI